MTTRATRCASAALFVSVLAFVALVAPAMRLYPGGTSWDHASRGHDFWRNYLCDLQLRVALDGRPNPLGSVLAQTAMVVLVAGFVPLWWLVPSLFASRPRLGAAVRALGSIAVAGMLCVAIMPSDRFGALHGVAILTAGVPGLAASGMAVVGLALEEPGPRVTATIGVATMATAAAGLVLYAAHFAGLVPDLMAIAVLERVAIGLVLAWMTIVAWRAPRVTAARGPASSCRSRGG